MGDEGIEPATGPLGTILAREDLSGPDGTVTVLVAPEGATCEEFAAGLAADPDVGGVRVLWLRGDGSGLWGDRELPRGDDSAWAAFAEEALAAGEAVLVAGGLAEAAAAAIWFTPPLSLTDGGSVEEARLRLSATAIRSRLVSGLRGGDFEALFGKSEEQRDPGLSGVVGRIVGYVWDLATGAVVPGRVVLYPDGLDNLSRTVWLVDPDAAKGGGASPCDDGTAGPVTGTRDLGDLAERLSDMRRTAYLPVLAPSTALLNEDAEGPGSRSFGWAFIPAWTLWPRSGLTPLDLVLQLDVEALPDEARDILGGEGTFQLFLNLEGPPDPRGKSGFLARVVDASAAGSYKPPPGGAVEGREPRLIEGWRPAADAPGLAEFSEGVLRDFPMSELQAAAASDLEPGDFGESRASAADVDRTVRALNLRRGDVEAVAEALAHHSTDKLLGWPTWEQGVDWPEASDGRPMALLFQFQMYDGAAKPDCLLAPGMITGDGTAQVFVTVEGKREFAFRWACG